MKKILVVDDESAIAEAIQLNIESLGRYKVLTELRGSCVIETAKKFQPNLILMDIMMPDITGVDVAKALKGISELRTTRVVFITSMLKKGEEQKNIDGMQAIFAKPIGKSDLVAIFKQEFG